MVIGDEESTDLVDLVHWPRKPDMMRSVGWILRSGTDEHEICREADEDATSAQ